MSQARIVVHHFVANATTTRYGPHPTFNLLGVDFWQVFPPDAEFPQAVRQIDLFTRFYLTRARPAEFMIRVYRMNSAGQAVEKMDEFGPFAVDFHRSEIVRDRSFRITNVRLTGTGNYAIRILCQRRSGWRAGKWAILRETHFRVEQ